MNMQAQITDLRQSAYQCRSDIKNRLGRVEKQNIALIIILVGLGGEKLAQYAF